MVDKPVPASQSPWDFWALVARAVVGGLFIISAVGKISAPEQFIEETQAYEMLPVVTTHVVAYVLPWIELCAGLLLALAFWRREARFLVALMLVVFTFAKVWTYAQGKIIDCGCGGSIVLLKYIYNSPQGIFTNIALLALLAIDWHAHRRTTRTPPPQSEPRP